jgi:hypothetical protein
MKEHIVSVIRKLIMNDKLNIKLMNI